MVKSFGVREKPSGVDVSLLRVEGLSRLLGFGWCSGDLTMADMSIWCRAWAGVEGAMCSWALKWAAGAPKGNVWSAKVQRWTCSMQDSLSARSTHPLLSGNEALFSSSAELLPALRILSAPSPKPASCRNTASELPAEAVELEPHLWWCQHPPDGAQIYPKKKQRPRWLHTTQIQEHPDRTGELFTEVCLTFFFFVGWSILAWRKSISLVCWEMVPSILTFSWEYTACRKEQRRSEAEAILNTTLKEVGFFLSIGRIVYFLSRENMQLANIPRCNAIYIK